MKGCLESGKEMNVPLTAFLLLSNIDAFIHESSYRCNVPRTVPMKES